MFPAAQGLPEWDEILARGDEEEALERAARRSREQQLQVRLFQLFLSQLVSFAACRSAPQASRPTRA